VNDLQNSPIGFVFIEANKTLAQLRAELIRESVIENALTLFEYIKDNQRIEKIKEPTILVGQLMTENQNGNQEINIKTISSEIHILFSNEAKYSFTIEND
jgi:hypothetical protein